MREGKDNKDESIAVIIPCYNYGRFVGSTIETALSQTLKPAEIIVVDDGSDDDTADVCKGYEGVRYIWKPNGGVSSARNVGFNESSARYVMFPDADDVLKPDGLKVLWEALHAVSPRVEAAFGRAEIFSGVDSDSNARPTFMPDPDEIKEHVEEEVAPNIAILSSTILTRLVRSNIVPQCSALIARSVYEKIGPWDEDFFYHQDRDIWLRIASRCKIAYVDHTVAGIRRHDENITHRKNWVRNHTEILHLLDKAAQSTWAPRKLRGLAKGHYASGAYNLAQRLADSGQLRDAARLMRASAAKNPLRWKSLAHAIGYSLKGLLMKSTGAEG